jgi:hypothetical protein
MFRSIKAKVKRRVWKWIGAKAKADFRGW